MTPQKLLEVIQFGESTTVEFKLSPRSPSIIGVMVCSFLNTAGGVIVIGARDDGTIHGVVDAPAQAKKLESLIMQGLSPKPLVWFGVQSINGKDVIVIEVPAGSDPPFAFQNVVYLRVGAQTIRASIDVLTDMIRRRSTEPERWERCLSVLSSENDVDLDEVIHLRDAIQRRGSPVLTPADGPDAILNAIGMAKYGRLTQGGVVLVGKDPGRTFPQVRVRAIAVTSDKTSDVYRDQKQFEGPLVQVIQHLTDFVVRNTPTVSTFTKKNLQREDACIYPVLAIREALVNAVAHRDYTAPSGGVTVTVYPKRLEIWNSGELPKGITSAALLRRGHLSILVNPDIAHGLYLRGLMEKAGRGTLMITAECKKAGLPAPEWQSDPKVGVTLTLRTPEVTPQVTPEVTPQVTPEVAPEVRVVLALEGDMRSKDLMEAIGIRDREDFRARYLRPALAAGLVEMTIPDAPKSSQQRYRLTKQGLAAKKRARG